MIIIIMIIIIIMDDISSHKSQGLEGNSQPGT